MSIGKARETTEIFVLILRISQNRCNLVMVPIVRMFFQSLNQIEKYDKNTRKSEMINNNVDLIIIII